MISDNLTKEFCCIILRSVKIFECMQHKKSRTYSFPVIIEKDEDGLFVGTVPALRNCYTQAKTLSKLYERLDEVVALCLEVENDFFKSKVWQNEFLGVQKLEFSV